MSFSSTIKVGYDNYSTIIHFRKVYNVGVKKLLISARIFTPGYKVSKRKDLRESTFG